MALAQKLEEDNLRLVCQRSVEELHQLFVAWFQGTDPREGLTTALMECLAPGFSHVAPNGQFLQGRGILIGHLQDKYGCYKNRLFQIEIYDVRLLWHDASGSKCLCTYEEWQSWLPDNAQQLDNNENGIAGGIGGGGSGEESASEQDTSQDEVHQFGRLSTCLLERKEDRDPDENNNATTGAYRWIHVHETWLEAESPQHEKPNGTDARSFLEEGGSILTGPVEYHKMIADRSPPNMLGGGGSSSDDDGEDESSEEMGVVARQAHFPVPPPPPINTTKTSSDEDNLRSDDDDSMNADNEESDRPEGAYDDDDDDDDDDDEEEDGDRHLLMLMSTQSVGTDQMTRQDQARDALESSGIAFYELDGANPEERENRNSLFQLSGKWGQYPQFFLVDTAGSTTFWGTWDQFWNSHLQGRLAQDIMDASFVHTNAGNTSASETEESGPQPPFPITEANSSPPPPMSAVSSPTSTNASATPTNQHSAGGVSGAPAEDMPPLAGPDTKLLLLISAQTLSRDQKVRQEEAMQLLAESAIDYYPIDGSAKATRERRNQLFRISTHWGVYPQLFHEKTASDDNSTNTTTYWGAWEQIDASAQRGTLKRDLEYLRPPSDNAAQQFNNNNNSLPNGSSHTNSESSNAKSPIPATAVAAPSSSSTSAQNNLLQTDEFEQGVILLMSQQSLSREQMTRQDTVRQYLNEANLPFTELDGSGRDLRHKRNELFKISRLWGRYPQLFVSVPSGEDDGTNEVFFFGDWDKMESSHAGGTFESEIREILARGEEDDEDEDDIGAAAAAAAAAVAAEEEEFVSPEEVFMEKASGILQFEDDGESDEEDGPAPRPNSNKNGDEFKQDEKTEEEKFREVSTTLSPIPQDVSSKRHVSSQLLKYAKPLTWENSLVGLSVHGFDIGTSQGPVADESWYKEVTDALETVAQFKGATRPRRKLGLPETVFPTAHVALEGYGFWLSWDVLDAMEEWARAHCEIAVNSSASYRGVRVLNSKDPKLWEKKNRDLNASSRTPSLLHYDWTYSTPFCGKVEGGEWVELDESGMRVELLTDASVPILFFDEIALFEDNLHNNGQVQFTVKLRVMPSCAYVLARLWLRVDNVVVRVRETRLLVDFFGMDPAIYRDVTWRECYWDSLKLHKLPTSVKAWHFDGKETPAWQNLLRQIPEVDPPEGVMRFATLQPNKPSRNIVRQLNSSVAEALSAENTLEYLEL